jgi:hypothetical protein
MSPERTIKVGDVTYVVRFGHNANYLLEEKLEDIQAARQERAKAPRSPLRGVAILSLLPETQANHLMLWAGLEGGRLKTKSRPEPFTVEEVGDLIDEAGGLTTLIPKVLLAWNDANPGKLPAKLIAMVEKSESESGTEKNAQEETPSEAGTSGSSKGLRRGSRSRTSGT